MKIILLFLLFNVYVNSESIKRRAVNLALETVLEFNKKDRASDIKFIDDVQTFLNKVKHVLNKKETAQRQSFRRALIPIPLSFTEFLENIVAILKSYDDYELKKIIKLLQNEIRGYNYKGCKFYELLEQEDVKDFLDKKLEQLKEAPLTELRRSMDKVITELHDRKLSKDNQEIVDYINSLYNPEKPRKLLDVLNNLQVYQTNSKRSFTDLTRIVRHGLRNIVFNHYSQLEPDVRRGLKIRLEYLAKNSLKQIIDHRVYDINDDPKTTQDVPVVTILPSTTRAIILRQKTTRVSSVENSGEYIHVYPKDIKHKKKHEPKKELLRTVWEDQWTTDKNTISTTKKNNGLKEHEDSTENHDSDNVISPEENEKHVDSDDSKVQIITTETTTNKKTKKAKKVILTSTTKTDTPSIATTKHKRHRKKHHNKPTTATEKITTKSTAKTKRRKKKKVHKKYVDDKTSTTQTGTTKKEHHKHQRDKESIINNLPGLEEKIKSIDFNKLRHKKKLKWKKDHDSRNRTYATETTLGQKDKLKNFELSREVKSSENEVQTPRKKKFKHIVLGMPMAEDRYGSSETTKKKIWTHTKDKKVLQKKLERKIHNQHLKEEKESRPPKSKKKKEKLTTVSMKTPTNKVMHTLKDETIENELEGQPGRFRVTSREDEILTKSSCEDAIEDTTVSSRMELSDEGLTIESFEDRAKKLFVGRRVQNGTDASNTNNKPDSDSVLKRIDIIEKELQDVKHIILDKESKKSSDNEMEINETGEEYEITSYENDNSTEGNTTVIKNTTLSAKYSSTLAISTATMLRKGFEVVSKSKSKADSFETVKNDTKVKTTTASLNKTETTTKSSVSTTNKLTTFVKLIFRTGGTNITDKILDEKSIKTTKTIKVANATLSINNLIENFISQEESTKTTKKKLLRLKNSTTTTTEMPLTIVIKNVTTILSSPIVEATTIVVNSTTNRLNASNIMRMSNTSNNNENLQEVIKKRLDFYYDDNRIKSNNSYDDLLLDDLRDDGSQ